MSSSSVNDNSVSASSTPHNQREYVVYGRRWFILSVIVILNLCNAMGGCAGPDLFLFTNWITFSPIADLVSVYYDISAFKVNVLSLVFMVASIPFGFVASWVLDTFGLRASILLSTWLNGVGAFLRNVSTFDGIPKDNKYTVLLIGQILTACAQPFVMFAPTKLAALWFPEDQRATANMLASMANPLGILCANVLGPALVNGCNNSEIPRALWVISAPSFLVVAMATFGVCSSLPPTPPTASADEESEPFLAGLIKVSKNRNYWILCVCFGTGLAIFSSLTSFLDQILCPKGYSNDFSGLCGALMIVGGVIGAVISGIYVDKTKKFEEVVKLSLGLAVLFGVAFSEAARFRDQNVIIAIMVGIFGVFGFALYPISMELAVEITYPVAEATSAGLLIISGQIQGIALILVMQALAQPLSEYDASFPTACAQGCSSNSTSNNTSFEPQDWTVPGLVMNGLGALAACVLILGLKGDYKRMKAEKSLNAQRILDNQVEHT